MIIPIRQLLVVFALCVGAATSNAALSVHDNGTVTDSVTGLIWDQCVLGISTSTTACDTGSAATYDWPTALAQAVAKNAAAYKGYTDWRVPNYKELESITRIDSYTQNVPATDVSAFPSTPLPVSQCSQGCLWTSTPAYGSGAVIAVEFSLGTGNLTGPSSANHVRLVRGGLGAASTDLMHRIDYQGNNATAGNPPADSADYLSAENFTVLGNTGNLVRTGYAFAGWNTAADGTGQARVAGQSYAMGSSDVNLYAQWTINSYSVTFDSNGGTGSMNAQSANYNTTAALTSNAFTRTGYTFAGWNSAPGGGGATYANAANYTFSASTTLYAQWTINSYSVTFDANGGTGSMNAQSASYNTTAALTSNAFARIGYTFTGWNTVASGVGGTAYANAANYTFTTSTTLYAQWTPIFAPTVTAISPSSGTTAGGTSVTITGTGFTGATGVTIGGSACTPLSATSASSVTCTTAAHAAGTVSVLVTTPGGTNTVNTLYTYVAPTVEPPAEPFIPVLTPRPAVPGIGSDRLTVLNLGAGAGPSVINCLRETLNAALGPDWLYQGQNASGIARMGRADQTISFYALDANPSTSNGLGQGPGIYLRGSNLLNAVTSCGTLLTAPALFSLGEFGAFLQAAGLDAQINTQGVITVTVGSLVYVARPDYLVTQGAPGLPALTTGADGLLRFTDSAGRVQILYPAFLDPETLVNQVWQAVNGWTVFHTDGTALVTLLDGQKFVLIPDLTLGTVPPGTLTVWWQDGPNHYRIRTGDFSNTSQGFTVTPR
jgi:uncharacterized repeat protein (TIGR02543 family)